jgi:hypothetical protein
MGEKRNTSRILVGEPEGWNRLEYLGVGGRIILKIYVKEDRRAWTRFISLRIETNGELV